MVRWSAVVLFFILLLVGGYNFDVEQAFTYYGSKIFPSSPGLGVFIFLLLMTAIIFTDEILDFFKKDRKIRLKRKF